MLGRLLSWLCWALSGLRGVAVCALARRDGSAGSGTESVYRKGGEAVEGDGEGAIGEARGLFAAV